MSRCVCGRYSAIFAIFVEIYRQMEDFLLRVEHVSKHYSGHTALDDVSLDIPRGSVYGLLGPNGAGKTTLIRIVNRITAPDEGRVLFDGRPLASADVQRIGYLPEERGLYKKMKVGEQALFFRTAQRAVACRGRAPPAGVVRPVRHRVVVEPSRRGAVEGNGAEGTVHRHGAARTRTADLRRTLFGLRPDQRQSAQRGDSGVARPRGDGHLLDPQHVVGRGGMRPYHAHRPFAQHRFRVPSTRFAAGTARIFSVSNTAATKRRSAVRSLAVARSWRRAATCRPKRAAVVLHASTEGLPELQSLTVHVADDAALRGVIAAANETVALRSFAEQIPSMNDIFIRAVDGSL